MSLFVKRPKQCQLQQGLDRDRDRCQTAQTEEYSQEQTAQTRQPIFRTGRKEFVVDVMGGWEKP